MLVDDQQFIELVASEVGKSHWIRIGKLKKYSAKLYDLSIASNRQTPGNGRVLLRVISVSVKALIAYVEEQPIEWEGYSNHKRPIMLKDLWHFAQEYEVDGLKERTLEELREWADPGYSNWDYVSNNVQAISAPDVPAQLYQEMVKVWAEYSIKKSRVYEGKLMDAAYRVERFGVAVQEEIAQMGGSSSKTMC